MKVIGFIGSGQMATALAKGIADSKLRAPADICGSDRSPEMRAKFANAVGKRCFVTESNVELAKKSNVIFLSVKPSIVPIVLREIKDVVTSDKLIVSIAAGVTISTIQSLLGSGVRVVRVMPNTPCLVGETAAAYALGANATKADGDVVNSLLSACGVAVPVKESMLDAVTGLSGSGPAYVYIMIEAMADGGVRMGLPRQMALQLAAKTVLGAAKMVIETAEHPGMLKDKVASPGGTTIAGIEALEKGSFRATVMSAIRAATERSKELGKPESKA